MAEVTAREGQRELIIFGIILLLAATLAIPAPVGSNDRLAAQTADVPQKVA